MSTRLALLFLLVIVTACGPPGAAKQRLSIATGGTGGVYYPYGGGLAKIISENLDGIEATAEVTAASADNLKFLRDGRSDIAFTLADTLAEAVNGRGAFADVGAVPVRALAVLYTNVTHIVTLEDAGIASVSDLRGHVVSTGAPGSGTELIAFRVLESAGIDSASGVTKQALAVSASVDALKDGKIDAFFWSGGLPTAAVLDLAHTPGIHMRLLPSAELVPALQQKYGANLYVVETIPQTAYAGLQAAVPVVGVTNLLVVNASMSDDLAYRITKLLFDKQAELAAIHPEARKLSIQTAAQGSPAPFHPGAIKYYRERGVWKD